MDSSSFDKDSRERASRRQERDLLKAQIQELEKQVSNKDLGNSNLQQASEKLKKLIDDIDKEI